MDRRKFGTSTAIVAVVLGLGSLGIGSAASAGAGDLLGTPADPPRPPRPGTLVGAPPVPATTCGGVVGCGILSAACALAGGTYSEWHSDDHGHPHGICTWPWE
jgi:hypothetical protein